MSKAQMVGRAASAYVVNIGFLADYELVFNRRGSYRPGGVASVSPRPGAKVYGVIYSIQAGDLKALDQIEDPAAYRRLLHEIVTLDGKTCTCFVYEAIPNGSFSPAPEYLRLVIAAATESGLPQDYIEQLRKLR